MRIRWSIYHARYRCFVAECDRWAVLGSPVCRRHADRWLDMMEMLDAKEATNAERMSQSE